MLDQRPITEKYERFLERTVQPSRIAAEARKLLEKASQLLRTEPKGAELVERVKKLAED